MRKVATVGVTLLAALTLTACGSSGSSSKSSSSSSDSNTHTVTTQKETDRYFKDNYLKMRDLSIKITKTAIIPVGNTGNEYNKKPVFAIWYTVKNITGKDIEPLTAAGIFEAYQEGKNTNRKLEVGFAPDDELTNTQDDKIKKGKTAKGAMCWELADKTTPIKLTAVSPDSSAKIGSQTYNIK